MYGFFIGYLNVPAHVYSTAGVIMSMPWSFKFLFGLLSDCMPMFGYRRKPYMCIGWGFCCIMLLILSQRTLPPPYWCRHPTTGAYIVKETLADGTKRMRRRRHCAIAAKRGGQFAMLMMLAALGVVADVAADGLTVQTRGGAKSCACTQTTAYPT